ncbi:hypothetical protein [Microscilla marina]|uniref:Uncharacterized protein n=1 Tax=Microscilla marina ATCC 23134 TaxID=313606 RepID=A1ZDD1_MICM2|nr:hypothetical protein [Microscilla marina]EAY31670.1 hypothetical protein M23134_05176 [Microscilla marina ATCC 23134]
MKDFNEMSLAKDQCLDNPPLCSRQIAVIFILVLSALLVGIYGHLTLAGFLSVLVLSIIFKRQINYNISKKYALNSISRLMAEAQFPDHVQLQVSCVQKQRYVVLTTQKSTPGQVLIIEILHPELVDIKQMRQALKHYEAHQTEVYMIINSQWEQAAELKSQLAPYISIYRIYNLLDNCLVHLKGKLEQTTSISV